MVSGSHRGWIPSCLGQYASLCTIRARVNAQLAAGLFSDSSLENFQRQADVNYLGTVKTIKAFLPGMLERRQGHICIISSALAICGG